MIKKIAGMPTVIIGSLLNNLKNDNPYMRPAEYALNYNLLNQAEQFSYLLNQKILSNQINQYYFNAFNQILINYDSIWSTWDLHK